MIHYPAFKTFVYIVGIFLISIVLSYVYDQPYFLFAIPVTIVIGVLTVVGFLFRFITKIKYLYFIPHVLLLFTIPFFIGVIQNASGLASLFGGFFMVGFLGITLLLSIPLYFFTQPIYPNKSYYNDNLD